MGRMMGIEPMNIGTTIRGLNPLATPAIILSLSVNEGYEQRTLLPKFDYKFIILQKLLLSKMIKSARKGPFLIILIVYLRCSSLLNQIIFY